MCRRRKPIQTFADCPEISRDIIANEYVSGELGECWPQQSARVLPPAELGTACFAQATACARRLVKASS